MIFLRLACLLAGILVLVAPTVLFPNGAADIVKSAPMLVGLVLAAASFFFIAMAGHRIKRSPALGRLCAGLLLVPFLFAAAMLWRSAEPSALWVSGALLSFTMIVSVALLGLVLQGPSARHMRAHDPVSAQLQALRQH